MGLSMFIVGFLGLTFLITSGCILYFKQMDESEDEKLNYTILRKLGFTQGDLLKGVQAKQAFNFGIPLIIGLFHSKVVACIPQPDKSRKPERLGLGRRGHTVKSLLPLIIVRSTAKSWLVFRSLKFEAH